MQAELVQTTSQTQVSYKISTRNSGSVAIASRWQMPPPVIIVYNCMAHIATYYSVSVVTSNL